MGSKRLPEHILILMDSELKKLFTGENILSKRSMLVRSFLGGIAWGVGSVIGATFVVALLIAFLRSINWVPIVGDIAGKVSQSMNSYQQRPQTGP